MSDPAAEGLRVRLVNLSPRSRQVLMLRAVGRGSKEHCARHYGIGLEAFDLLVLRALQEFLGRPLSALGRAAEVAEAKALSEALEGRGSVNADSAALVEAFEMLAKEASAIVAGIEQVERAAERSGARKRQDITRWAFIAVILTLTAYFYFRPKQEPRFQPRSRVNTSVGKD